MPQRPNTVKDRRETKEYHWEEKGKQATASRPKDEMKKGCLVLIPNQYFK